MRSTMLPPMRPEADEADLHQPAPAQLRSPRTTRRAVPARGRRARAASQVADACALLSCSNVNGLPGISTSSARRRRAGGSARSPGRPCGTGRSSAGSAGRSRTSSSPSSRRGSPRAARRPRASTSVARRAVGEDRDVVRRRGAASSVVERARRRRLRRALLEHALRVVLGLLHVGLVERVDAPAPSRRPRSRTRRRRRSARGPPRPPAGSVTTGWPAWRALHLLVELASSSPRRWTKTRSSP